MIAVIGSGPTGVACAKALLKRGREVTLVDAGLTLEPEREAMVARIRAANVEEWRGDLLAPLRGGTAPGVRGLPEKRSYGSDYAFRAIDAGGELVQEGVDTFCSYALGGLSNVWGANALPFLEADLDTWPISSAELAPFYREVLEFVPLAAARDELEELFPLYAPSPQPLRPSAQAAALLARLRRARAALRERGVHFGQSRLAVRVAEERGTPGCVYCGNCLYGCPYRLIYSSASTLQELRRDPRFRYVSGVVLERFEETSGRVRLSGRHAPGAQPFTLSAERAFVACGAVNTTRIVLQSLDQYDREVDLLDSQYFMLPAVTLRASPGVLAERLHTLSQVSLEILDSAVSARPVHLLVYTYNDLFRRALEGLLAPLGAVARPALPIVLGRISVVQGYLHSDDSARIGVRLERDRERGARLVLRAKQNARTRPAVAAAVRKLRAISRLTGVYPLGPLLQVGLPGKSYHLGGSFPMHRTPSAQQTDVLGRVGGFERVHLVDASVFPAVPATNSTLGAMANAFRIATLAAE